MRILALMERTGDGWDNLVLVLFCAGVMVVVIGVMCVPMRLARGRKYSEVIMVGTILWGILVAGSIISVKMDRDAYVKERGVQIASGYFDPGDTGGEPAWPWGIFAGMGLMYGGLVLGASQGGRRDKGTG